MKRGNVRTLAARRRLVIPSHLRPVVGNCVRFELRSEEAAILPAGTDGLKVGHRFGRVVVPEAVAAALNLQRGGDVEFREGDGVLLFRSVSICPTT